MQQGRWQHSSSSDITFAATYPGEKRVQTLEMKILKKLGEASPVAKLPPTRDGSLPPLAGNRPPAIRVGSYTPTERGSTTTASLSGADEGRLAEAVPSQPSGEGWPYEREGGQPENRYQTPVAMSRPLIRWAMTNIDKSNKRVLL